MISAVGVTGNVENLGLEALGVKVEHGMIATDGRGRTNVSGLFAIGDVAGPPMLAHKAEHEGVICVEAIKGLDPHPLDKTMIPGCTYCNPQVASVGLTEAKAKELGFEARIGRFPFIGKHGWRKVFVACVRHCQARLIVSECNEMDPAFVPLECFQIP